MKQIGIEEGVKKRHPEGVALVVCKDEKGKVDITPIGWFMIANAKPRCWAISLQHRHYSHKVISETGEFVLCLPSYFQKKDILYCGSVSGWNEDKLKKTKFKTISSKKVKPPILKDCIACFECRVIEKTKVPDHTIFIGEILSAYISDKKDKIYNLSAHNLIKYDIK